MKKYSLRQKIYRYKSRVRSEGWRVQLACERVKRKVYYHTRHLFEERALQTTSGKRFLELSALLTEHLERQLDQNPELAAEVGSQLLNVLKNCDEITYEEAGTAQAYALLHFLNRYHRFQLTFAALQEQGVLPKRTSGLEILDIGTGPGPSMFATSDFFSVLLGWKPRDRFEYGTCPFRIDYVERSFEFRNWLHHLTEYVNYWSPSGLPWQVPFHHGTFHDFQDIQFNQPRTYYERDGDDEVIRRSIKKHRFDVAIFSNFLTTKDQVLGFRKEIEDCARYLRHNGILIVVGAPDRSKKYQAVYKEITSIVLDGKYGRHSFKAHCREIKLAQTVLSFKWDDPYGSHIKDFTRRIFEKLKKQAPHHIPEEAKTRIEASFEKEYNYPIEWEVRVFKKIAKPRTPAGMTRAERAKATA